MGNASVDNVVNFINSDISEDNIKLVMTFMLILSILCGYPDLGPLLHGPDMYITRVTPWVSHS